MFTSRLVHKDVGADQCNNMLLKLEEDAEVAYLEYEKAVKAEDRAESYVTKVKCLKCIYSALKLLLEKSVTGRSDP